MRDYHGLMRHTDRKGAWAGAGGTGRKLGSSLGLKSRRTDDWIRELQRGLPFGALKTFVDVTGWPVSQIATALEIPERTLARRRTSGRLAPDESERLFRLSRIFEKAVDLFEGDLSAATTWLSTPRQALSDQAPLAYVRTELGAREVENLMGRLEHGVFS
jgi:putative toxin-antitoxin system antitoxin component (TIGR02293 family)